MSALRRTLVRQFGRPSGPLGAIAGWIMSTRPSNRERSLRTLDRLAVRPSDRVLEIGFGPGLAIAEAARRVADGHVAGVDHSELMLRHATHRNAEAIRAGRVSLHLGSASSLPPLPGPFDRAFAVNVQMFWDDPVAVLEGIGERLAPGGALALTHQPRKPGASDDDTRRSGETIARRLSAAGYRDVDTHLLGLRPVDAVCVIGTWAR